ncbi:hypothetical protein EP7_001436 [Isosphaeraceae bacterium EP7]
MRLRNGLLALPVALILTFGCAEAPPEHKQIEPPTDVVKKKLTKKKPPAAIGPEGLAD